MYFEIGIKMQIQQPNIVRIVAIKGVVFQIKYGSNNVLIRFRNLRI